MFGNQVLKIKPTQLVLKDRGRKDFSDVPQLMDSIKEFGLIHPICVSPILDRKAENGDDLFELIAGERRFRAMCFLGWKEIPCVDRTKLDAYTIKALELEENIQRTKLDWNEEIFLKLQLDELKKKTVLSKDKEKWTTKDTAILLNEGRTQVHQQIAFAKKLRLRPDLQKRVSSMPLAVAIKMYDQIVDSEKTMQKVIDCSIKINLDFKNGDCRQLIKTLISGSVDLVLTDPPYGILELEEVEDIGLSNSPMGYKSTLKKEDNLNFEEAKALLEELMPELFRVMKEGAHIYIFCSFFIYSPLLESMKKAGFLVSETPIIWDKKRTTAPWMGYEYSPCYDPILFGHKPPKKRRLNFSESKLISCHQTKRAQKVHVFEKPQDLLRKFIENSTSLGETVLDPFAGGASTLLAAKRMGRRGVGFELSEEHYCLGLKRLEESDKIPVEKEKEEV